MSLGTHTRCFGTQVFHTRNVHLAPQIVEFETNKQRSNGTACRGLFGKIRAFIICRGLKETKYQPWQTAFSNIASKIKYPQCQGLSRPFSSRGSQFSPANTQFGGNKRLVLLENKKKHTGKVERNAHSYIPTSN